VTLKPSVSKRTHLDWLSTRLEKEDRVTYHDWNSTFFNGFSAFLSSKTANIVRTHPEVEKVENDGTVHIDEAYVRNTCSPALY
jgi:cerevisin